jgi:hypothetical protein
MLQADQTPSRAFPRSLSCPICPIINGWALRESLVHRIIFCVLIAFVVSACVTGERMQSVRDGMSKEEVISHLGNPDGLQRVGDYEALRYTNRLISGWSWDRADYNVILKAGRVVEYGPGQVRQRDPNVSTLILVPLR